MMWRAMMRACTCWWRSRDGDEVVVGDENAAEDEACVRVGGGREMVVRGLLEDVARDDEGVHVLVAVMGR